jgi:tol-pal system protein YbgF
MKLGFVMVASMALVGIPSQGHAQTDTQKIERLERQLNLLSQQVFQGATSANVPGNTPDEASPASGGFSSPASALQPIPLEQQQQRLLSRIEELEHELDLMKQKVDDLAAFITNKPQPTGPKDKANEESLTNLNEKPEADSAPHPADKTPDSVARDKAQAESKTVLPEGSIQEQYDQALAILKAGEFKEASKQLHAFLKNYGDHELAANATYWLGETYFAQKNYEKAVVIFAQGYKAFSKGPKGPDMLLKIGLCLEHQKKPKDACITIEQLSSNHPNMAEGIKQATEKAKQRLKCG